MSIDSKIHWMTVKEVIEELRGLPSQSPVKIATGFFDKPLAIASIYDDEYGVVWIDALNEEE